MDEDTPKRKIPDHQIGQVIDNLSIEELRETIVRLQNEVDRLEKAVAQKSRHLDEAATFFTKKDPSNSGA